MEEDYETNREFESVIDTGVRPVYAGEAAWIVAEYNFMVDISEKAKAVLNDPRLITKRDDWVASLQNLFDGRPRDTVMAVSGVYAQIKNADMKKDPEDWVAEGLENLAENAEKIDNDITFTPLCIEAGYYGVHFVDSLFGSEVFWNEDSKQWFARHIVQLGRAQA
jgi:hypothetical protein